MDSLTMTSSMVMGDVTPINYTDQFQGSVTLTGLDRLTTYFYRVMSTNSGESTFSTVGIFNTSALGNYYNYIIIVTHDAMVLSCSYGLSLSLHVLLIGPLINPLMNIPQLLSHPPRCSALKIPVTLSPIHATGCHHQSLMEYSVAMNWNVFLSLWKFPVLLLLIHPQHQLLSLV